MGFGCLQDDAAALNFYLQSARRGNPAACFNVGVYFEHGLSVAADRCDETRIDLPQKSGTFDCDNRAGTRRLAGAAPYSSTIFFFNTLCMYARAAAGGWPQATKVVNRLQRQAAAAKADN
jgi:TPR repeat protein